ncbi:zinc ion binding [Seminavis robusta]|uniref:Zinc ion binding n=1 Tax=Seminavis robusta TaxID=568900 RepID=A0A9N8E4H0_9STRA|nr:zinc ion binding [Seminavis robusta]|eukprot:Sro492_g153750.1 zinc ion binding (406) ;mRNA; f:9717-11035
MSADIVYMVLVGAGGILTMVVATYVLAVAADRICSSPYSTTRIFSPISNAAGIWGMSPEDREKVLEKLFSNKKRIKTFDKTMVAANNNKPQGEGIEMVEIKKSSASKKEEDVEIGMNGTPMKDATGKSGNGEMEIEAKDDDETNSDGEAQVEKSIAMAHDLPAERLDHTCSICLVEYEHGDILMNGTACSHLYHKECIMAWMMKGHDHCPFCRELMMTPQDLRTAALEVLGPQKVQQLSRSNEPVRWQQLPADPGTTASASAASSTVAAVAVSNDNDVEAAMASTPSRDAVVKPQAEDEAPTSSLEGTPYEGMGTGPDAKPAAKQSPPPNDGDADKVELQAQAEPETTTTTEQSKESTDSADPISETTKEQTTPEATNRNDDNMSTEEIAGDAETVDEDPNSQKA